jgi:hypothetical protein
LVGSGCYFLANIVFSISECHFLYLTAAQ